MIDGTEVDIMKHIKAFAIVNVIVGVVLLMAGVFLLFEEDTFPAPLITIPLGIVFWVVGGKTFRDTKMVGDDISRLGKLKIVNTVLFILGCIILAASLILPIVGPMIG